jgi:hypothetical protein
MIAGSIPKNGREALPGLVGVTPASGVITLEPVSVCQYVYSLSAIFFQVFRISTYVNNMGFFFSDNLKVPLPDFGGDWLSDGSQNSEVLHFVLDILITGTLE